MSYYRRCDVCDKNFGEWMLRKKWRFFKWVSSWGSGQTWKEEKDICDECFERFRKWILDAEKSPTAP